MFSLSLLILLQSKTLLKKAADSADYVKEVAENIFADVGPDGAAEEGERGTKFGDYINKVFNYSLRDLL